MSEGDGDGDDLPERFGGSIDVDQSEYEKRVIEEYNEKAQREEEQKRKENENLLRRIKGDIERVENVLKSTKDSQVVLAQKARLKQLHLQEKGVQKILERKKQVPREEIGLVQPERENTRMISMGILTPFEALTKGKDVTRGTKSRMQRTSHQPKTLPGFRSRIYPRGGRGINRQNLRNRKVKIDPNREQKRLRKYKKRKRVPSPKKNEGEKIQFRDDGDDDSYRKRMKFHYEENEVPFTLQEANFDFTAFFNPTEDKYFEGGYKLPGQLDQRLFGYQRTGVKWLWQLHQQSVGGILGDEMGLGKTIEIISFLGGLHYSGHFSPSLVIVPATVLSQWVQEFHEWWPYFKVVLLHSSGSYHGYIKDTIRDVSKSQNGVIITTYESLRIYTDVYGRYEWGYLILDEGHKIRNPNSEITLAVKKINTPHRILMTGTPIQNTLKELWSQFDFVFPGLLGTLPVFQTQFGIPIVQGQYSNASEFHVYTAYRCARHLRDLIQPYLLRRMKKDVGHQLPRKRERILFCKLSPLQLRLYRQYLRTKEVKQVSEYRSLYGNKKTSTGMVFKVLSILRQICNHPDILVHDEKKRNIVSLKSQNKEDGDNDDDDDDDDYGDVYKSGKLKVVEEILTLWKKNGHKVLLYSQSLKMLDILERFVNKKNYTYLRMDGSTSISKRLALVNQFNNTNHENEEDDIFVFLLTTKVGGIGVNLTGADRILLFDPDWNPSTDVQAMERSWRIGQTREVHVYRLMTSGTIEEKIYHRQIFKQFLTNKILQDPKQKRFFKENRLRDLFQLGKEYHGVVFDDQGDVRGKGPSYSGRPGRAGRQASHATETSSMFKRSEIGYDSLKRMIREEGVRRKKEKILKQQQKRKERSRNRMIDEDEDEDEDEIDEDEDDDRDKRREDERRKKKRMRRSKHHHSNSTSTSSSSSSSQPKTQSQNNPQDTKKKKKRKKKKGKMKTIHKVERVKYGDNNSSSQTPGNNNQGNETSILKSLFDSNSIHNIIDHEVISEGTNENSLIQKESKKIADEAIRKIKDSRDQIRKRLGFRVGEPTWTGHSGGLQSNSSSSSSQQEQQRNNMSMFGRTRRERVAVSNRPSKFSFRPINKKKKKKKRRDDDDVVIVTPPPPPPPPQVSSNKQKEMRSSQIMYQNQMNRNQTSQKPQQQQQRRRRRKEPVRNLNINMGSSKDRRNNHDSEEKRRQQRTRIGSQNNGSTSTSHATNNNQQSDNSSHGRRIFGGMKKKGGLQSSEVISRIRSNDNSGRVDESVEMIRQIVQFFKAKGFRPIETKDVVENFAAYIHGEKRFVFRSLLRQAAVLEGGNWVLRKEFHN